MQNYRCKFARLIPVNGGVALESSYDEGLVRALKSQIPPTARRWDKDNKRWMISSQYDYVVAGICETYLGIKPDIPSQGVKAQKTTKLIKLEYLGACKEHGAESIANGYCDGGWNVSFPEFVLREWFEFEPQRPGEKRTLFAVLGIKTTATVDEIKSAYRRLAKQWHPDLNQGDPDAAEQFKIINSAYEVLSDDQKRNKYTIGLQLENSLKGNHRSQSTNSRYQSYRAPLKCGWVLVEGIESLGKLIVSKILQWEDVTNELGQTMISSWPRGSQNFVVNWR